jgi:hypothetical protein
MPMLGTPHDFVIHHQRRVILRNTLRDEGSQRTNSPIPIRGYLYPGEKFA